MTGGIYRPETDGALLAMVNVYKTFPVRKSFFSGEDLRVRAVDGVSLTVPPGKTLGLVGESGCGKTTLARLAIRLLDPDSGSIRFEGNDITRLEGEALRTTRRQMQIVFQDPYSSLNPRMKVRDIVGEGWLVHGLAKGKELRERAERLLVRVGMPTEAGWKYPHEFSGGQRQRIGIARAIALSPKLVVADEPVSALDVSIQAQIVNLLQDLQEERGLTYVFIAHDLSVVRHISDRIAVMYLGNIVEVGPAEEIYTHPRHPYSVALLSAVPEPDPDRSRRAQRVRLEGDIPSPLAKPSGCAFRTRCPIAQESCAEDVPALEPKDGRLVACPWV